MKPLTLITFGDSVLDCARYNEHRVSPGELLIRNNDVLFPEYAGRDLSVVGRAHLEHRALDGATVNGLARQATGLDLDGAAIGLLTIGGNDLLAGLIEDNGPGMMAFERTLDSFLYTVSVRPMLIGTVYDPTFGDDTRNRFGVDPVLARRNHRKINTILAEMAGRYGVLVDLHQHFMTGDPSWYVYEIEPSLIGASEVRGAFLEPVISAWRAL